MTNDLSQCGNCIYHYTYNGRDMCKQVGDDFYLQWKVENCPYHTIITRAAAISDEIYRLRAENAALQARLEKAVTFALDMCSEDDCAGDGSVGLPPCDMWHAWDTDGNGVNIESGCYLKEYLTELKGK